MRGIRGCFLYNLHGTNCFKTHQVEITNCTYKWGATWAKNSRVNEINELLFEAGERIGLEIIDKG